MKFETFEQRLINWGTKYKWFDISLLPNWEGDWKTCIAIKGDLSFRSTMQEIFELLSYWNYPNLRPWALKKYLTNNESWKNSK